MSKLLSDFFSSVIYVYLYGYSAGHKKLIRQQKKSISFAEAKASGRLGVDRADVRARFSAGKLIIGLNYFIYL